MADLTPDTVAVNVIAGAGGDGAAKFEGWLAEAAGGTRRLYTDQQFMEWLEFASDEDILHQIDGTDHPEGSSVIWVKRDAIITRCQSGCAYQFAELETAETADDPAARRPRPYP